MQKEQIIEKIMAIAYSGSLGVLWGLANILYKHAKGENFNLTQWIMSLLLSFLVSRMVGEFIPQGFQFRDGILWVSGAVAMAIMNLIQIYGAKYALKNTPLGPIMDEEDKK